MQVAREGKYFIKTLAKEKDRREIPHEIVFMIKLRHTNLVKIVDYRDEPKRYVIKMADHGTDISSLSVTVTDAIALLKQMLDVLGYLHSQNVTHCDVKPRNIVKSGEIYTLIDLGSAVEGNLVKIQSYTLNYTAPEVLANLEITQPDKIDVWGLGVTILEKLSGNNVFAGGNAKSVLRNIFNYLVLSETDVVNLGIQSFTKKGYNRTPLIPKFYDKYEQDITLRAKLDLVWELIIYMLTVDPVKRPNVSQISQSEIYCKLVEVQQ